MTNVKHSRVSSTGLHKVVWHKEREKDGRFQVGVIDDVVSVIVGDYNFLIRRIKLTPETARRWEAATMHTATLTTPSPPNPGSPRGANSMR
jgi:hypothetical protein